MMTAGAVRRGAVRVPPAHVIRVAVVAASGQLDVVFDGFKLAVMRDERERRLAAACANDTKGSSKY